MICCVVMAFSPRVYAQEQKEKPIMESLQELEKNVTVLEAEVLQRKRLMRSEKIIDDLDVLNMDLKDVFKLIETKTGVHIICDEAFEGRVTLSLKEVNAFDALRIILEPKGLAYEPASSLAAYVMSDEKYQAKNGFSFKDKLQVRVVPLFYVNADSVKESLNKVKSPSTKAVIDPKANAIVLIDSPELLGWMEEFIHKIDVPVETKTFPLQHKDASSIASGLQDSLTENVGRVVPGATANSIIVTDTPEKLIGVEEMIRRLDTEDQKIQVQIHVLQVLLNDEHQNGVDWEAILSNYQKMPAKDSATKDVKIDTLRLGVISSEDYLVLLEALNTIGMTRTILAAEKDIQKEEVLPVAISPEATLNLSRVKKSTVVSSPNQFEIFFTPLNQEAGELTLRIQPKARASEHSTEVKVRDGATIVVGSMFADVTIESIKKFPFLGSIPFLGVAFQSQRKDIHKSEVIVFLTVKFLPGTEKSFANVK
ncbi:MAG: hypothetical protein HQL24_05695 [Candidatus Omnitrophica bacterium]|nr:hypothetical protein [Candidatus Omnitrophota bacterium]